MIKSEPEVGLAEPNLKAPSNDCENIWRSLRATFKFKLINYQNGFFWITMYCTSTGILVVPIRFKHDHLFLSVFRMFSRH